MEERDSVFWYGFHPEDRDKLSFHLVAKLPDQHPNQHYPIEDVSMQQSQYFLHHLTFPWSYANDGIDPCHILQALEQTYHMDDGTTNLITI